MRILVIGRRKRGRDQSVGAALADLDRVIFNNERNGGDICTG